MTLHTLTDADGTFEVTLLEAEEPSRVVLFAVGRGGQPERHLALLDALAERGCVVVAPHFAMISPQPSEADLTLRARRLVRALELADPRLPVAGLGHSIGATSLLALAGARLWLRAGHALDLPRSERLDRLALLAPVTDFFQAPGALDGVEVPMLAWAGTADPFAPPAQIERLERALGGRLAVDLRFTEGAGHFSFMSTPPPGVAEPLADREAFQRELAMEVGEFVVRGVASRDRG